MQKYISRKSRSYPIKYRRHVQIQNSRDTKIKCMVCLFFCLMLKDGLNSFLKKTPAFCKFVLFFCNFLKI